MWSMSSYDLPPENMSHLDGYVIPMHGEANASLGNLSFPDDEAFFVTYYSPFRFWTECSLAAIASLCNLLALAAVLCPTDSRPGHRPSRKSIYHLLFVNLAIANILTCVLSVICNNILFLFEDQLHEMIYNGLSICVMLVFALAGVFVTSALGIESFVTMLGFATIQYFAICCPLENLTFATKKKIGLFLLASWMLTLVIAFAPLAITSIIFNGRQCTEDLPELIFSIVLIGVNTCVSLVAIVYVVIIFLCVRIYYEVRQMERRISQFRSDNDMKYERKAFFTTLIILTTLTIFLLPYSIIHIISLNSSTGTQNIQNNVIIYYMNLLPYLKCLSDPLIYGLKMREFHEQGRNLMVCYYRLRHSWRANEEDTGDDSPEMGRSQHMPLKPVLSSTSKTTYSFSR